MSTALDLDLEALVGDLPAVPCESFGHVAPSESDVHGGPATEYCRITCPSCGKNAVKSYCAPMMAYIRANRLLRCGMCSNSFSAGMGVTILGPVNGRAA
jgi:hypothetical protein